MIQNKFIETNVTEYINPQQYFEKDRFWCCVFAFSGHHSESCATCKTFTDLYLKIPDRQLPNNVLGSKIDNFDPFDMNDVAYIFFAERGSTSEPYNIFCRLKDGRYAFVTATTVKSDRTGVEKWIGYSYIDDNMENMIRFGLTEQLREKHNFFYNKKNPGHSFEKIIKEFSCDI
jgi:hypothetical protein